MTIKDFYEWIVSIGLQDLEISSVIKILGVIVALLLFFGKSVIRLTKIIYSYFLVKSRTKKS